MWHVVPVAQRLVASPEAMYATTFCECTQQVSCLRRTIIMNGIYSVSLGCLNPRAMESIVLNKTPYLSETVAPLCFAARSIRHKCSEAGIALEALAGRLTLWYEASRRFDNVVAGIYWREILRDIAGITSAPWFAGLSTQSEPFIETKSLSGLHLAALASRLDEFTIALNL